MSILKFAIALLFLPVVIGITSSFLKSLSLMDANVASVFGWGVISYLILHIILYEPAQIYDAGKKVSEKALVFFSPLVKVAGFCIPIFTILSFIIYFLSSRIWKEADLFPFFVFLASFSLTMHLVFTVNSLKRRQPGSLKENYFFAIFVIYIINMLIVAAAFDLATQDFSFLNFFRGTCEVAGAIYTVSFRQLFDVEHRRHLSV